MKDIWEKVIKCSLDSLKHGDIPIGAVIVCDGKIIGTGCNTRELDQSVIGHAEINAINEATKVMNNWNLSGCSLFVSLKPCSMCMEVIKQSRISNVYYLLDKPISKKEFYRTNIEKNEFSLLENEYKKILSDFFKELREKKQ